MLTMFCFSVHHSFIHSFIHSLAHLSIHSFSHSLIDSLVLLFIHSLTHSFLHSNRDSFGHKRKAQTDVHLWIVGRSVFLSLQHPYLFFWGGASLSLSYFFSLLLSFSLYYYYCYYYYYHVSLINIQCKKWSDNKRHPLLPSLSPLHKITNKGRV